MSEVELKKLFQIEDILSLPNAIFKIIFDNDERLHHIYIESYYNSILMIFQEIGFKIYMRVNWLKETKTSRILLLM